MIVEHIFCDFQEEFRERTSSAEEEEKAKTTEDQHPVMMEDKTDIVIPATDCSSPDEDELVCSRPAYKFITAFFWLSGNGQIIQRIFFNQSYS